MLTIKLIIGAIIIALMLSVIAELIINDPIKHTSKVDSVIVLLVSSAFMYFIINF